MKKLVKRKILYIDDSEDMGLLMGEYINIINEQCDYKYELTVAENGNIGIDKTINETPDIVFLDFSLPDMSADDVFSKLKSINPNVSVIIISGHNESYIRRTFDENVKFLWKMDWAVDNIQDVLVSEI